MDFDPTLDYSFPDINDNTNLTRWKFWELIKTLVTLSSPADRQAEIIGIGATCDEMAIDFDTFFSLGYSQYVELGLLTLEQVEALKEIDLFFDERSGDKCPDFWDDYLLETNEDWKIIRKKAADILDMLGMPNLEIDIERTERYGDTINGRHIVSQSTKTKLVKKT